MEVQEAEVRRPTTGPQSSCGTVAALRQYIWIRDIMRPQISYNTTRPHKDNHFQSDASGTACVICQVRWGEQAASNIQKALGSWFVSSCLEKTNVLILFLAVVVHGGNVMLRERT